MPTYNAFTTGDDYRCAVTLRGDIPQRADIEYGGCDLLAQRKPQLVETMAEGTNIDLKVYDLPPGTDLRRHVTYLKKADGEMIANVSVLFGGSAKTDHRVPDPYVRINHFNIDPSARRSGLGTTMLLTVLAIAEMSDRENVQVWIGDTDDDATTQWLIDNGFPAGDIDHTPSGNLSFDTTLDRIGYDRGRVSVIQTANPIDHPDRLVYDPDR